MQVPGPFRVCGCVRETENGKTEKTGDGKWKWKMEMEDGSRKNGNGNGCGRIE